MKIWGIILAAGRSSRMGRIKQLLDFEGKTILEQVMENALNSSLHRLIVVLGHGAEQIQKVVDFNRVKVVVNERYDQGLSTSIRAGLNEIPDETEGVVFILGDQPLVGADVINAIIKAYQQEKAPLVIPTCRGRRGNPVLADRSLFHRLKNLTGNVGARVLFEEYADQIKEVEIENEAVHFDVDTLDDYAALIKKK
ncbi:MAG: molybdenum cofactor cytidylyltransferase [Deltaproteobacteria bacterium]|nr:molybdenum cofactor cytidylyltransferase [Deltaproteobacteria bacterium]